MELDFSKIDSLGSPQKPASEPKEKNHSKTLKTTKKPAEGKIEPQAQALQRKADGRKKQLEDKLKYRFGTSGQYREMTIIKEPFPHVSKETCLRGYNIMKMTGSTTRH